MTFLILMIPILFIFPSSPAAKELSKIAVWDLTSGNLCPGFVKEGDVSPLVPINGRKAEQDIPN